MGHHTHPTHATARSLPLTLRRVGLILLCLLSFRILAPLSAAHAIILPYYEFFDGDEATVSLDDWYVSSQTEVTGFTPHDIHDNALRIVYGGTNALNSYYALFLTDNISGDFTAVIQIPYLTNTGLDTRAGLIFQRHMTDTSQIKSQLQVAVIPDVGFRMSFDEDNDGTAEETLVVDFLPDPPEVWLKVIKKGNNFYGYYSTNATHWTPIGTIATPPMTAVEVGLFGKSGQDQPTTAHFDNLSLVGATTTYIQYEDSDEDRFGNPFAALATTSETLLDGYVKDNTDCDDTDADIYPGATEVCDGKDNDCDGTIDEGFETTIYYRDADNDGFGTSTDTHPGCSPNTGYVAIPGDCNDSNPLINPGAPDILDNSVDEDCAGGPAESTSDTLCDLISDTPLSVTIGGSTAIVMFILDDSGNMEWTVMCPENEGTFNGQQYYTNNNAEDRWKSQYHGYNSLYYNPNTTYEPWPKSTSYPPKTDEFPNAEFTDAEFANASTHPLWGTPLNLTSEFITVGGNGNNSPPPTTISHGHYYVTSNSQPYLVDLGTSNASEATYYEVTDYDNGDHGKVNILSRTTTPPTDVVIPQADLPTARTNFANWFTYHRTRELTTKAALGNALQNISGLEIGLHTFDSAQANSTNEWSVPATLIETESDVADFLDNVYKVTIDNNSTRPMELALEDVGQYFDARDEESDPIGDNPYALADDGGNCQQAFAILLTSGYGNGGNAAVGGTLPDVAEAYYVNDLAPTLANNVPVRDPDYELPNQHMVTYAISFGIEGNFEQSDYPNCPPSAPDNPILCPNWSNNQNRDARVDELWHTAVNGRGKYIDTNSPRELSDAINTILSDIVHKTGTAASVAVSSEKLDTGLVIYQGYFNSGDWSGNLEAYSVNADGELATTTNADGETIITPMWSAKTKLDSLAWGSRTILTKKGGTVDTVAFRYDSLSTNQQSKLSEDQVNYLRGEDDNEVGEGGPFRNRSSKLGDITHSSPILHDGYVYVGANDGMFHAFDANTGSERFAYVPSFVYPNLAVYTSPYYSHRFYADGTATAKAADGKDWVVSGLRRGGRGLFGINVTSPVDISEAQVPEIWEYPNVNASDSDVGFVYGEATIAPGNDSDAGSQLVFAANGYDSPNGHAVLLILRVDPSTGSQQLFAKIDTEVGSEDNCNGLSTPLVVDMNDDGKADAVYAGDLQGNLWKFDVSNTDKNKWDVAYKNGSVKKPLFTARNNNGDAQPITSKPAAMFHCDRSKKGPMVVFGTGRMLSKTDLDNASVQTIYGIWDWQAELESKGIDNADPYSLGTFGAPADNGFRALENLSVADGSLPSGLTLVQQTKVTRETDDGLWRYTSNNPINWFNAKIWIDGRSTGAYAGGSHLGWYMNLPTTKERVITKTQLRDGKAYVISIIPEPAPCAAGGTTVGTIINACNGGQLDDPQWDTDGQNGVDANDDNPSGKIFDDDIYYAPAIIEDKLFFTKDRVEDTADETRGLFYWRIRD